MTTNETRPLYVIANEIRKEWPNTHYAAIPYLNAMDVLTLITEQYGADSAKDVVLYFLSNAKTWRGDAARRIKAELKAML